MKTVLLSLVSFSICQVSFADLKSISCIEPQFVGGPLAASISKQQDEIMVTLSNPTQQGFSTGPEFPQLDEILRTAGYITESEFTDSLTYGRFIPTQCSQAVSSPELVHCFTDKEIKLQVQILNEELGTKRLIEVNTVSASFIIGRVTQESVYRTEVYTAVEYQATGYVVLFNRASNKKLYARFTKVFHGKDACKEAGIRVVK